MLLPTSADRRPLCDLQLGGLEPAVGVWSGLGRAIMASDTFVSRNQKEVSGCGLLFGAHTEDEASLVSPAGPAPFWLTFCPLFSPVYIHNFIVHPRARARGAP